MGGTLNATTEQAAEDERRAAQDDRNHTILTHGGSGYVSGATPAFQSPLNAASQPPEESPMVDSFKDPMSFEEDTAPTSYARPVEPQGPTLAELDQQNRSPHEDARAAIDAAFTDTPAVPNPVQADPAPQAPIVSPALPPLPDFSTLPPMPELPQIPQAPPQAGALPPEKLEEMFAPAPNGPAPVPQPVDPAQYKIPGQL
jgi:hypothetical protein